MARDESENLRVRPGRSRNGGARINPRTQPFLVQIAVRKAGDDPRRIGSEARSGRGRQGGKTGRFNARGRGLKVVASFPRSNRDGGCQRDSAGRFRARRVVVRGKGGPAQSAAAGRASSEDARDDGQGRGCPSPLPRTGRRHPGWRTGQGLRNWLSLSIAFSLTEPDSTYTKNSLGLLLRVAGQILQS
jgi:hypothetical protein